MAQSTAIRQGPFETGSDATAREVEGAGPWNRYDLATALRIVRRMETSATRGAVFAEIKRKNPLYRLVDALYSNAGIRTLRPFFIFAYMMKSILSVGPFKDDDAEAVAISNFDNERHSIERVAALAPGVSILRLTLKRRHLFGFGQLRTTFRMLGSAGRIWPFLMTLVRSHSFMPSARIASALAFYIRFVQLFAERPSLSTAIVASNYSPEAIGLAAAAHRMGRRVIYINHAPVPANGALVPPVLADCAIFYGDAVRQTYERRSRCTADIALIGQPWAARPMQWRQKVRTVGIFLTALTRVDVVSRLVATIRVNHPDVQILIRNHPVALLQSDFSELENHHERLKITIGNPLDEEAAACDLIICGNSGVAMNAVSGGRPVAYMDSIDGLNFDYNGFVESGLICHVESWSVDIYSRLRDFYERPEWRGVMNSYDASYCADLEALNRTAAEIIARHFGTRLSRNPASPARSGR